MRLHTIPFALLISAFVIATTIAAPQTDDGLSVESTFSFDPLVGLLTCLRADKPGYCFQKRALGYFESWVTSSENEDGDSFDADGNDGQTQNGITPQWTKVIDQVAERISDSYGNDDDEEDDEEADDETAEVAGVVGHLKRPKALGKSKISKRDVAPTEDGRGHKKKKTKAIKKALIKLILFALLIKSKLKILLTAFQTFLGFKGAALLTVLVVTHAIKLWAEIKHHQTPQKVIYYENAHHQHHYEHDDHDHHGWNLWGRKGEEATTESSGGPLSFLSPLISKRRDDGADLAYTAYNPYNDKINYNNNRYNDNNRLETSRSLTSNPSIKVPRASQ